jgi:glycerophosphoryl diester phosphodiesterase
MNIAHRGGAQLGPENTLATFAGALAHGSDGVELDVQLSRDGVAVVHHDWRLMKDVARKDGVWLTAPGPRIKDLTLEELRQFDVGTARPDSEYALGHPLLRPIHAPVPALNEVVELAKVAGRRFLLFVELKCNASEDSADPQILADATCEVIGRAFWKASCLSALTGGR